MQNYESITQAKQGTRQQAKVCQESQGDRAVKKNSLRAQTEVQACNH